MDGDKIKTYEKKIRILFIFRCVMWAICAAGTIYWIYWSFKLYETKDYAEDYHLYATAFRPYFNLGIAIALGSLFISLILRLISDSCKRAMKEEMFRVH